MDVDTDVDGQLIQQFLSMGTQDKEALVSQFQKLLGNQVNPSACAFFLDMNNWNLPAAIGSYYDFEQSPATQLPVMTLVKDITIGEGEAVSPDVNFIKTWRIKNSGTSVWPPGCSLKFYLGHQLGSTERVMVDALAPGSECDVSVHMRSPRTPGIYEGQWRMSTPTGALFGDTIWVILQVCENGLLDLAQGMSQIGNSELGVKQHKDREMDSTYNPFSSPPRHLIPAPTEQSTTMPSYSDNHLNSSRRLDYHIHGTFNKSANSSLENNFSGTTPTKYPLVNSPESTTAVSNAIATSADDDDMI